MLEQFFLSSLLPSLPSAPTCIGVEEIAHLDVPMNNPVLVQVCHAQQQLQHQVLDLGIRETCVHVVDKMGHVVLWEREKEGRKGKEGGREGGRVNV